MIFLFWIVLLSLCWGSFLNVIAYRLTYDKSFFTMRSQCPHCNHVIAWYDLVPVISWIMLGGKCRTCRQPISILYPFIELVTVIIFISLYLSGSSILSFISFAIFFSALICATRTDFQEMVIPQVVSLWLVPVGILFSFLGGTIVTGWESIVGAIFGYGVLWIVAWVFKKTMRKEGLGVGDMELLALIGSFLGPLGAWFSLMAGAISGLILGGACVYIRKKGPAVPIPFGPFLAFGATLYFFFNPVLLEYLLG